MCLLHIHTLPKDFRVFTNESFLWIWFEAGFKYLLRRQFFIFLLWRQITEFLLALFLETNFSEFPTAVASSWTSNSESDNLRFKSEIMKITYSTYLYTIFHNPYKCFEILPSLSLSLSVVLAESQFWGALISYKNILLSPEASFKL